jgi:ADP-ribose pyrophosphatase YjhB (NUDIX family)
MTWLRRIEPYLRPFWQRWSVISRGLSLGVRGLVVDAEGRVLLVEHTYIPGWYMPGGGVERGETAEEALRRELMEEAGVEMIGRPTLLSIHDNRQRFRGDHILFYRVDHWRSAEPSQRGEILNRGWFALDALPPLTTRGTRRRLAEALGGEEDPSEPHPFW